MEQIKKPDPAGTPGTPGTDNSSLNEDFDVDAYFSSGQFPVCFSSHLAISDLKNLTNVDGKPIHKSCKAEIEDQKKSLVDMKED